MPNRHLSCSPSLETRRAIARLPSRFSVTAPTLRHRRRGGRSAPVVRWERRRAVGPTSQLVFMGRRITRTLDGGDELNARYLHRVLDLTGGNKTQAAEILGIDRRTVDRMLARERAPHERGLREWIVPRREHRRAARPPRLRDGPRSDDLRVTADPRRRGPELRRRFGPAPRAAALIEGRESDESVALAAFMNAAPVPRRTRMVSSGRIFGTGSTPHWTCTIE